MSRKNYETVHGIFLEHNEQLADAFVSQVTPQSDNLVQDTNRFMRQVLCSLPQDTRHLRFELDDTASFSRWAPTLEDILDKMDNVN